MAHVDDPIVAGTSEGIGSLIGMFFQLIGTELKVKENPALSREAQVFLGANFSRLQMQMNGVMKDVIIEGSIPGYFKNIPIQAGMERGSAVGTAGVKLDTANDSDEYIGDESHKIWKWLFVGRARPRSSSFNMNNKFGLLGDANCNLPQVDEAHDEILTWK
eukprot:284679-Amphidinium_carterae.3